MKANLFDEGRNVSLTTIGSESAIHHHHAHGYDTVNGALVLKGFISHVWPYSAGSLCSTASDLSLWLAALHGGRLLSADSYRAMTTPTSLADGTKVRYGFGVGVARTQEGAQRSFTAEHQRLSVRGRVAFPTRRAFRRRILNTAGPIGPSDIAREIVDAVLGSVARTRRRSPGICPRSQGPSRGSGVDGRLP